MFAQTISILKQTLLKQGEQNFLVWDKDDKEAMDFVTACANIRAHIFSIPQKSGFAVKCKYYRTTEHNKWITAQCGIKFIMTLVI